MPFNITDFSENLSKYGTGSANKFDIGIAIPPLMATLGKPSTTSKVTVQTPGPNNPKNLPNVTQTQNYSFINSAAGIIQFRAESCTTPGVAMMTTDTNKLGVGARIKQPYNAVMNDVHVRFLADAGGELEAFFNTWTNLLYNYAQDGSTTATFMTNYRNEICSAAVSINKYDDAGDIINTYNLFQALPTVVSPISLGWEQQNTKVKFIVNFSYVGFTIT